MERSWTMVTVMGKGNWERMVLPSTPLLELTMYQQMHTNRMRTNSRTSDLDTSIPAATVWSLAGDYIRDSSHVVSRMLSHRNICTAITRLNRLILLQVQDRSWAQHQVSCVTVVMREALHGTACTGPQITVLMLLEL